MVVAEHVQHPVHHEQRHLVVVAAGVGRRLALRHRRAHDDVAEQEGQVTRLGIVPVGPGRPGVGPAPGDHRVVDGEGEHVGGAVGVHEPAVQLGDGLFVDEEEGQLGVAADPLGHQHVAGERDPAVDVDRRPALLVGPEDLDVPLGPLAKRLGLGPDVGVVAGVRRPRRWGVGGRGHERSLAERPSSVASARS